MVDLISAFSRMISIFAAFAGVAGVGFFVWGAYMYMSAAGSAQKADTGKTAMLQASVGVILVMIAFTVINVITTQIGGTTGAIEVQQLVATDAQRLVAPRLVSFYRESAKGNMRVRFSEAVRVHQPNARDILLVTDDGRAYYNTTFGGGNHLSLHFVPSDISLAVGAVRLIGFNFKQGATIKDADGNNAVYVFQPTYFRAADWNRDVLAE